MFKWMSRKKLVPICPACEGKKLIVANAIVIPPIAPDTFSRTLAPLTCPNCGFIQFFDYDHISIESDKPDINSLFEADPHAPED
jgi:hypothetical protein